MFHVPGFLGFNFKGYGVQSNIHTRSMGCMLQILKQCYRAEIGQWLPRPGRRFATPNSLFLLSKTGLSRIQTFVQQCCFLEWLTIGSIGKRQRFTFAAGSNALHCCRTFSLLWRMRISAARHSGDQASLSIRPVQNVQIQKTEEKYVKKSKEAPAHWQTVYSQSRCGGAKHILLKMVL